MQNTRGLFLAGGAIGALAAASTSPRMARASTAGETPGRSTVRFASEFGAVGDGVTDDTAALQAGLDWSSESLGTLLLDVGFYAVSSIALKPQARMVGAGAGLSFYARAKRPQMAGAVIVPTSRETSETALVTIGTGSTGAQLENLATDGYNFRWGGDPADPAGRTPRCGLAVLGGIEVVAKAVRVVRFAAPGVLIEQLNNARWTDVFVDRCGTEDAPAFVLSSPSDGASNFLVFDGLTVERSANTAISIAVGDDPVRDWASNVTFTGLHVESNRDYGAHSFPINTKPLIDVGNVRAISFFAPQVLGGAAPMFRYRQTISTAGVDGAPGGDQRDQQGGVFVLGGQFQAHNDGEVKTAAVEVSGAGRGVTLTSVKFASLQSVPAVRIAEDYRFDVLMFGNTFRWVGTPEPAVRDDRVPEVRRHWGATPVDGDLLVRSGDLRVGGRQVRVAARSPRDTTIAASVDAGSISAGWVDLGERGAGTDTAGRVFVANWKPVTGPLVRITFERPVPAQPIVMLTARNARAAGTPLWVELETDGSSTTGFTIRSAEELVPGDGVLLIDYFVVGRE